MTLHYQYLSVIVSPGKFLPAEFGAQIEGRVAGVAQWLSAGKIYQWGVKWRDWRTNKALYDENALTLTGYPQIITVKVVPEEYRLWPEFIGSPPREDAYPALAAFVQEVINRYKPEAVELANEPDVRVKDAFAPECFGAWVADNETWQAGGRRYGACVKYVCEHVTGSKILAGALMMHPNSLNFLKGALAGGLGAADGISYHCYIKSLAYKELIWKQSEEIAELTPLPQVVTETALIADVDSQQLRQDQADYLRYLIDNIHYSRVAAILRYTLAGNGWACSDVQRGAEPTPEWMVFDGI